MNDFTYEKYSALCNELISSSYTILTVRDYLSLRPDTGYAVLRHDVDTKPHRSLRMARLEHSLGISSTYYFRHTRGVFDPQVIREVADLGHEIGYHYEVLSTAKGDYAKAIALFLKELADFQKIAKISTICMHGSPLSPFDNRDLWKVYDFRNYGITGEAYLSMGAGHYYFSDTGWRWDNKYKVRDLLPHTRDFYAKTTDDIISAIHEHKVPSLYLLVHAGNWASNRSEWIYAGGINILGNAVKSMIMWGRPL